MSEFNISSIAGQLTITRAFSAAIYALSGILIDRITAGQFQWLTLIPFCTFFFLYWIGTQFMDKNILSETKLKWYEKISAKNALSLVMCALSIMVGHFMRIEDVDGMLQCTVLVVVCFVLYAITNKQQVAKLNETKEEEVGPITKAERAFISHFMRGD